jgi:adenylate cyclase, class 2
MLEVELKVFCGTAINSVRATIADLGWSIAHRRQEEDIYYSSRHKDFIATEECLRIRKSEERAELTWKPPTSDQMRQSQQYWKQEVDLDVSQQVETIRQLLACLEFYEYVVVTKSRTIYRATRETIVCLDEIENLGWFVEIETKSQSASDATRANLLVLSQLGLDNAARVNVPYRDLVKEDGRQLRVKDVRRREKHPRTAESSAEGSPAAAP